MWEIDGDGLRGESRRMSNTARAERADRLAEGSFWTNWICRYTWRQVQDGSWLIERWVFYDYTPPAQTGDWILQFDHKPEWAEVKLGIEKLEHPERFQAPAEPEPVQTEPEPEPAPVVEEAVEPEPAPAEEEPAFGLNLGNLLSQAKKKSNKKRG